MDDFLICKKEGVFVRKQPEVWSLLTICVPGLHPSACSNVGVPSKYGIPFGGWWSIWKTHHQKRSQLFMPPNSPSGISGSPCDEWTSQNMFQNYTAWGSNHLLRMVMEPKLPKCLAFWRWFYTPRRSVIDWILRDILYTMLPPGW